MKRLIILFSALVATLTLKAQVFLIDDFTLSATEGAYGIYTDIDCQEDNVFFVDMQAPNEHQYVQLKLWGNYLNSFVSSLRAAEKIYSLWSQIAKEKNVTFLSKDIKVSFPDKTVYFTVDGKWYLENGVDMKCKFMVSQDGTCYLVLQSDYLTSSEVVAHGYSIGNAYNFLSGRWGLAFASSTTSITRYCSGASLTFSSSEEIEMFIQKLYDAKEWKKRNKEQGKLFR